MKKSKKLISLLLSLLMVSGILIGLSSCGEDLGEVVYGRYVEEDVTPEGFLGSPNYVRNFGDVIEIFTNDYDYETYEQSFNRYRSTDAGKTWTKLPTDWADPYINQKYDETTTESMYLNDPIVYPNGDIILRIEIYNNVDYTSRSELKKISLSGEAEEYTLPILEKYEVDGKKFNIGQFEVINDNLGFLNLYKNPSKEEQESGNWSYEEIRVIYDINTNEEVYKFDENEGWEWYNNEKYLFVVDYNTQGFKTISLETGKVVNDVPTPSFELFQRTGFYGSRNSVFVDENNAFYTATNRGITKLAPGAEEAETIMEGVNYTFGSPLGYTSSLKYVGKDILMTVSFNEEPGKILRYTYDEKAPIYSNRTLKIYSLYDSPTVRLAVAEYKKTHPEIMVTYQTPLANSNNNYYYGKEGGGDDAMTVDDAIRALNNEMLNGGGPDILILDGLSVESYIEKGILKDLSSLIQDKELYSTAIDPLKDKNGKIYALPTRFSVPLLIGEKGNVDAYGNFQTLLDAILASPTPPEAVTPSDNMSDEDWNNFYNNMYKPLPIDEQPVLSFDSFQDLFNIFYELNANAIYTQKTGINKDNLKYFLESVKQVSDKFKFLSEESKMFGGGGIAYASSSMNGGVVFTYSGTLDRYANQRSQLGYTMLSNLNQIESISYTLHWHKQEGMDGPSVMLPRSEEEQSEIDSMLDSQDDTADTSEGDDAGDEAEDDTQGDEPDIDSGWGGRQNYSYAPMDPDAVNANGIEPGTYVPTIIVGISTNSKLDEYATDFVQSMLAYDVQRQDVGEGLPVLKEGFTNMLMKYNRVDEYMAKEGFEKINFDYEKLFGQITTPYFSNAYLKDKIYEYLYSYCSDLISVDEAVNKIFSETELYFNERQ